MSVRLQRSISALVALLVAVTTLAGTATPASAVAPSNGAIDVTRWLVGSTNAATVTWTNPAQTTSVMLRSPWPWGASWAADETVTATGDTQTATNVARTITCTDSGANTVVFTLETATVSGSAIVTCRFRNTGEISINQNLGQFKGVWIENVTTASGAHISVAVASGLVTAPATPRNDTWLIGQYNSVWAPSTQAEVATVAYAPADAKPFDWALAMTPNAALDFKVNDELTKATCTAPTFSIKPKLYEFEFSYFPGTDEAARSTKLGKIYPQSNDTPTVSMGIPGAGYGLSLKCSLTVYATGAVSEISAVIKMGDATIASAPRKVIASGIPSGVVVQWQSPANPGSPISNYLVQAVPGGQVCITRRTDDDMTACRFRNLTNGTPYTFTVQALNPAGWSERSTASSPATGYEVVITNQSRKKLLLGLQQQVNISGSANGLPTGTKLTGSYKLNDGKWQTVEIVVKSDGTFERSLKLTGKNRSAVVQFKVSYTNSALTNLALAKDLVTVQSNIVRLEPRK